MKDQRGYSLIELIVVVCIIAILTGFVVVGVSIVYNANTQRAAERFMTTMKTARQIARAAEEGKVVSVKLIKDGSGMYAVTYEDAKEVAREYLCNDSVQIRVGAQETEGNKGADRPGLLSITGDGSANSVSYSFKKSTGGINETGYEDIYFVNSNVVHVIAVDIIGKFYEMPEKLENSQNPATYPGP